MKYKLLIVDDDPGFIASARTALSEFMVVSASSPETAKIQLNDDIDVLLLDLVFDESEPDQLQGMTFIPFVNEKYPDLPVIVMTNYSSTGKAVQAVKLGAEDFFNKKDILWSDWVGKIKNYCRTYRKIRDLEQKRDELESIISDSTIIGKSEKIEYVRLKLRDIAENSDDVTLFLYGETGTGKNLAVNYFRHNSRRRNEPYKELSISELSPTLLESQLFGHVKGAYTGANENTIGLFEAANRGILFLDEIGDYDLNVQAKIMRFIENKTICRVGSTKEKLLDVQLILATNKNIPELVKTGKFRADLYQRMNRIGISLPPLRERTKDISALTRHFFDIFRVKEKTNLRSISPDVIGILSRYSWPGNIRELQSVIWEACTNARLFNDDEIQPQHIRGELKNITAKTQLSEEMNVDTRAIQVHLEAIENALKNTYGNKKLTARQLGKTPDQIRYFIKKIVIPKYMDSLKLYPNIRRYYKIDI